MKNYLSVDGLTAIFKDAVMMPYNNYETYEQKSSGLGFSASILVQTAGILTGLLGLLEAGPVGAVLGFYLSHHFFASVSAAIYEPSRKTLWPNVTKFKDSLKPQAG